MRIKNKIKQLISMLLVTTMMLSAVPVNAEIATPTDSVGEVVFVPYGNNGEVYTPHAGVSDIVYDVYDDKNESVGEFVLSYDGRAYVDTDGTAIVFSSGKEVKECVKSGDVTEKTLKLPGGSYSIRQRERLYKSEKTVVSDSKVEKSEEVQYFYVESGRKTELKVVITEKSNAQMATQTDAVASVAVADDRYDIKHEKDVRGETQIISTLFKFDTSLTYGDTGYGFCMQEGKPAPSNYGTQAGSVKVVDKAEADIRRALYYSFVGPKPWNGWNNDGDAHDDYNIAAISATLDYYYYHDKKMSYVWKYAELANRYIAWLESQPYPETPNDTSFSVYNNGKTVKSGDTLKSTYSITAKKQTSAVVQIKRTKQASKITLKVPSDITVYGSKDGKTYKKLGSTDLSELSGINYVRFETSLTRIADSKITFMGENGFNAMMLDCGDAYQKVGFLGKQISKSVSLNIKWSRPQFMLKKTDIKGNRLYDAEYLLYRIQDAKVVNVARFKTDNNGVGRIMEINKDQAAGTEGGTILLLKAHVRYYITEVSAPAGYIRNKGIQSKTKSGQKYNYEAYFEFLDSKGHNNYTQIKAADFTNSSTGTTYTAIDTPVSGCFAMQKQAMSADGTKELKGGAVYTMYDSSDAVVAKFYSHTKLYNDSYDGYASITTMSTSKKYSGLKMLGRDGTEVSKNGVQLAGIPEGSYKIKETTVPDGCEAEEAGRYATLTITATGETLEYYYAKKESNGTIAWKLEKKTDTTLNAKGMYGDDIKSFYYSATDIVSGDPLNLVIKKVDAETGKARQTGAASLEGAVFKLEYYKGKTQDQVSGRPNNTWYIRTIHENGKYQALFSRRCLITDNSKYPSDPEPETAGEAFRLEAGTVRITEVTPSKGYLNITGANVGYIKAKAGKDIKITDVPSITVYLDGTGNTTYYYNALDKNTIEIYEPVKRGDLEFTKKKIKADGTTSPMGGVVFKITSMTTGEYHYVMTDDNGRFSSRLNKNTLKTNKNCDGYTETENGYEQGEMNSSWGLWFTGDSDIACSAILKSNVTDGRGALPYDTYEVREMRCAANKGYVLSAPQEITVSDNMKVVSLKEDFINIPYPTLTTLADHFVTSGDNVTLNDRVKFSWIKADTNYTLKGIVMDPTTEKPAVDGNGDYILATMPFKTPKVSDDAVNGYLPCYELSDAVKFTFNSMGMDGNYVVFEYLYAGSDDTKLHVIDGDVDLSGVMTDDSGNMIAHADITNEDGSQTFSVPHIETDAFVDENGLQEIQATEKTRISDKVKCLGLVPGYTYKLVTTAVFDETGESVKSGSNELETENVFIALKSEDTRTVHLPVFDATPYDGGTITIQQRLYQVEGDEEVLVTEHTDIDNERQQIRFVGIHTTAQDTETGSNFTSSIDEIKERTDIVTFTNLNIGNEYKLTTYLYDPETKEKVKTGSGEYITATKKFIADQKNMIVPVTIRYNPVDCGIVGKVSVFFEYLTTLGKDVASHTDLSDEGQSMRHPEVHTTLHETGSTAKEITTSGIVELTDTAKFVNLKEGYKFLFTAKFVNADTEKVINIDGKDAVVNKEFIAESDDGSIDMEYSFDIQKSGLLKADGTVSDVVCYEYVYYDGKLLYAEEDITNREQTISISLIRGKLMIHKRELQDKTKPVVGVTFMLFKKAETIIDSVDVENFGGLSNDQVKEIQTWKNKPGDMYIGTYITDKNGDIFVTNLTQGEYYVVETRTLDTYILCTDRPEFTIDGLHDAEITVTNEAKVGYITISGPRSKPSQGGGGTPGDTPNTGDRSPLFWMVIILILAIVGVVTVVVAKRKKRSKILLIVITIGSGLFFMFPGYKVFALAAENDYVTETSTEVYYTDDETDYNFKFEEKKADDKNTYTLDRVEYDKKKTHSTEIKVDESVSKTEDNVSADYKAPENIKQNGYTYILSKSDVTEQSNPVHVEAYKDTGYVSSEPVPDKTMQYTYVDENGKEHELVLPYSRTETMESGNTDVTYSGAVSGLNYQYIQAGDQLVPSENFILNEDEMKTILSQNGYDLSGLGDFRFSASPETYTDANGNLCRNYTITASRSAVKYRVYYADDVDGIDVTYKAVDVYVLSDADKEKIDKQNKETLVTATAYYKVEDNTEVATETQVQKTAIKMSPAKKAVLAGSIILGVLVLIALALYLVKGGRRDTDRKSKRDIKRDYKEL